MFGLFRKKSPPPPPPPRRPPPVPKWQLEFFQPLEGVVERVTYYTNRECDFVVFRHGTCVILPENQLPDDRAAEAAKEGLDKIYKFHPDMGSTVIDDGNMVILYNHPAINVVLASFADKHWEEIESNHQDALTPGEVLLTPLGPNTFDDREKKALFRRCYMFMDAQRPEVVRVVRAAV